MSKKNVAAVRLVERDQAIDLVELPEELRVSLAAIAGVAREGLLAVGASVGLMVMHEMMAAEMAAKVGGPKHAKLADRHGNWHGDAAGSVVLGGPAGAGRSAAGPHDRRPRDRARFLRPVHQRRPVVAARAGTEGLPRDWLTLLVPGVAGWRGCRYAEEVPAGVQA